MKLKNPLKWFEFKKEAIILFANLKRNDKAYQHLSEYARTIGFLSYLLGMLVLAGLQLLLGWIQ